MAEENARAGDPDGIYLQLRQRHLSSAYLLLSATGIG
jgi:hypothetical protein